MYSLEAVAIAAMLAGSANPTAPALPGGIIAWIVCNGRKRNPIGGWLLFYYWQLWSGLLLSAAFFSINIQSYVPENFDSGSRFALFLASAVPGLVLLLAQMVVATMLLSVRAPDMLNLLRWILAAQVLAGLLGVIIDAKYFPDNQVFSIFAFIEELLWLAYFFKSTRVRHIFSLQDWDVAVNSIYPPKLNLST